MILKVVRYVQVHAPHEFVSCLGSINLSQSLLFAVTSRAAHHVKTCNVEHFPYTSIMLRDGALSTAGEWLIINFYGVLGDRLC